MENNAFHFEFIDRISRVNQANWDSLAHNQHPFISYAFLNALEASGSVGPDTGWQPQHLLIYQNHQLVGILPLYSKTHSYGEYVFDFAWANAYHQHGLNYYPKLIAAIPFTPVTGSRLLLADEINNDTAISTILDALKHHLNAQQLSSIHWLFVRKSFANMLVANGFLERRSVQFQWVNRDYQDFSSFMHSLTARRRKSIRKERQKVQDAKIAIRRINASQIEPQHMAFFYQCYKQTYLKRSGHEGYLTKTFFEHILQSMPDNLMLVIAEREQQPIAAALYLYDQNQLCGRYWGSLVDVDGLHFECCYYQGIEFCIEQGIASFNPGTQGEHKILRGFEPIYCYSAHWLAEPAFLHAIERFLRQEGPEIVQYKKNAEGLLPFKQQS